MSPMMPISKRFTTASATSYTQRAPAPAMICSKLAIEPASEFLDDLVG
jgi:hypothetical protein